MKQYNVTGMSCAACSARVEKAVSAVEGVTSCSVSLLTNSMGVEGTAEAAKIIAAVEEAGYGASEKGSEAKTSSANKADALEDKETPVLKKRLVASLGFLAVLMYISMGGVMWGWPLPDFLAENCIAVGIAQMLLAGIVMVINQKFFISGFKSFVHKAPNMDTLVALGSGASFVYSTYVLLAMSAEAVSGNIAGAHHHLHDLYFESAAMILALITVGKMLEARSKGKTTSALRSLMDLAPKTANVIRGEEEVTVGIDEVRKGDIFVVRPGENIPVDGIILEGETAVNESALTGESVPVDKVPGSSVSAATINQSGFIKCEAARVGEDTTLSQIIKMVENAAATKAPIAKVADKVSGIFVPAVITIAVVTALVWLFLGESIGFAVARGISVLVISCPCALGLATPVAIMVGSGVGAKNGILFKTAASLEESGRAEIVIMDKTGTITKGEPAVTDIIPAEGVKESALMKIAVALEEKSEHPLAKAIVRKGEELEIQTSAVSNFYALPGNGVTGILGGISVFGGNYDFIKTTSPVPEEALLSAQNLANEGKTPLFFSGNGIFLGIIAVADIIKEESPEAVERLKNMGIYTVMLTGDNERTAKAIAEKVGVDEVIAGVLPEGKEEAVRRFKEKGRVAMVGDGINDAPALTSADIGIAIGAGTDVAIDCADVVLMQSRLSDVPAAIALGRATLRNIHENLFWAFIYNSIGIPVAAGALIAFGIELSPMLGAAAMSLSSFCVVTNALRLNLVKIFDPKHDRKRKNKVNIAEPAVKDEVTAVNGPDRSENEQEKTFHEPETADEISENPENGTTETPETEITKPEDESTVGRELAPAETNGESETKTDPIEKKYKVTGMMCAHCESHVKEAVEAIPGVEKAVPSFLYDSLTVEMTKEIPIEAIKEAVEKAGYNLITEN
ncbi:MAG: heavy metal translocating P-type ATPase [Oscillospiraceae bacterium]|nr:heavy metal translocating P-type ATPase [Oscillospiraceae bacterium]